MNIRCILSALLVVFLAGTAVLVRRHFKRLPPPPTPESLAMAKVMVGDSIQRPDLPHTLHYRLFIPRDYDPKKRYPLLMFLHSAAEVGSDNLKPLLSCVGSMISPEMQALGPFFVLVPQCPAEDKWVDRHDTPPYPNYDQSKIAESPSSKLIVDLISRLQERYSIDPGRRYITGFSMGASGAWDIITRHPGIFSAAVIGSGVSDPNRAEAIKGKTAVWVFHGDQDMISPIQNSRVMVERLRSVGAEVRFSELWNVGHDCVGFVYFNPAVFEWLLSHSAKPEV